MHLVSKKEKKKQESLDLNLFYCNDESEKIADGELCVRRGNRQTMFIYAIYGWPVLWQGESNTLAREIRRNPPPANQAGSQIGQIEANKKFFDERFHLLFRFLNENFAYVL